MFNRNNQMLECYDILRKELKNKEIDVVMRQETWKRLMNLMADEFNSISAFASSESDIATRMDGKIREISSFVFSPSGLHEFELNKERSVRLKKESTDDEGIVHVIETNGKIDSKYSSFLIEYKHPSAYRSESDTEKAFFQVLGYLNSLYEEKNDDYMACITDGSKCQFVLFNKHIKTLYDTDKHLVQPFTAVKVLDGEMANDIFKCIIHLQVRALTAENLKKDLLSTHNQKNIIQHLTYALYSSLKNMNNITAVSYRMWMDNFKLSHDDISKNKAIEDRRKDLAALINKEKIKTDEEYKILFALQTSIAILAMLLAYRVVILVKGSSNDSFKRLIHMNMEDRRIELKKIAEGTTSITMNVFNLLELNCFSWPFQSDFWTEETNSCITNIIETLMVYETIPDLTSCTDDLFRDLYMSIMPVSVRHSLGEYYTPGWLAENVILSGKQHLPFDKKNIRVLDSTAGSGTFPQKVIEMKLIRYKNEGINRKEILKRIINEVVAIDANTIAVILARINYFLAIADLVDPEDKIYIPVYFGDSSVPNINKTSPDGLYYKNTIQLDDGDKVTVKIPVNSTKNDELLIDTIQNLTLFNESNDDTICRQLDKICENEEDLNEISPGWVELKNKGLITPAVISSMINSFLLCDIGTFDLIVGNPPWVDWKTLPSVHRENKKEICYARNLFSGDGRTGGNSLNICALISNITAENWLATDGVMSILMPQSLLFQQSYEGYREFNILGGNKLYFQEIIDWTKAGHPFFPVQQLFCTYVLSNNIQDYSKGIPLKQIVLKKGYKLENIKNIISTTNFNTYFSVLDGIVGKASSSRSAFTYAKNRAELYKFNSIAGETVYTGREGVEYYPQELQLLHPIEISPDKSTVKLIRFQSSKSKIPVRDTQNIELESTFLRPLIKGINISRFHVEPSEYIVAFPYDTEHNQLPFSIEELLEKSPKLMKYYATNKDYLTVQTTYSDKIIGKKNQEYYALARTGRYCHSDWYVIFRDNTKWVAAVTGRIETDWGGLKTPAFQNHCVSICEGRDGKFITEDEAHYICAILNSHIVENYILSTSDKRTFKIRLPIKILPFDYSNSIHIHLSELSKAAHLNYDKLDTVENIRNQIDICYLKTLGIE